MISPRRKESSHGNLEQSLGNRRSPKYLPVGSSGLGLSHGLYVRLSYSLWLTHTTLYFHPAASPSEPSQGKP